MSQEILENIAPTRMELLNLRHRLELAERGHSLLKDKLEALTNTLFDLIRDYRTANSKVQASIRETMQKLSEMRLSIGSLRTLALAAETPQLIEIKAGQQAQMGVIVPQLVVQKIEGKQRPFSTTTSGVADEATKAFEQSLEDIIRLAEVQAALTNLAKEISDTKRRVNSLNYVIIPKLQNTTRWIELSLEEQERDEFVRLKKVKQKLES
ncbi:MAG: V-type ATP synthase subunit D [Candidatus Hermodarchaeota archaeon]